MSSTATKHHFSAALVALTVALSPGMARAWDEGASASALIKKAALEAGGWVDYTLESLKAGETYRLLVTLDGPPAGPGDRVRVELADAGSVCCRKEIHAGDPDFYLRYRPSRDGDARLALARSPGAGKVPLAVRVDWARMPVDASDRAAIEAEPNDSWQQANELMLGRDVYGSADDVDYLENTQEGKSGLDWFRFEVKDEKPVLVYFQLDLLDRDVSANLRVYTVDPKTGRPEPYLQGKDPMEIVHDRERERYSKHISRTFTRGTYYLEVNANHPDYILRTRVLPVPPYDDPAQAVEAGMHYIMNVGDAWFAQVPREGNIYVRADNLHDTATRCTACHPSSFSTEANLVAHRNGYPIRSKSNFQYVIDRLYNSTTPLYGDDGLYWQRFIAIPLQAQGKQGGILLDFERQVSGQQTKTVERFGPFLQQAWESRRDLPADEVNGVVPLDSKFGFAWRDWRVLDELARRTGRDDMPRPRRRSRRSSANGPPTAGSRRFQDRIHRLYAWWLIDKDAFANKIKRETGALLALQNADGGWHEVDTGPARAPSTRPASSSGPCSGSACRATTRPSPRPCVPAGPAAGFRRLVPDDHPRELPHADARDALRRDGPRRGVSRSRGHRAPDGATATSGPARLPRTDTLVHTLDDLENLWDVPAGGPRPIRSGHRAAARSSRADRPRRGRRLPGPAGTSRLRRAPGRSGSAIRPRSSGARRPGPCGGWATRGSASDAIAGGARAARTRRSVAGPRGSSPTSSTGWTTGSTWPTALSS